MALQAMSVQLLGNWNPPGRVNPLGAGGALAGVCVCGAVVCVAVGVGFTVEGGVVGANEGTAIGWLPGTCGAM